MAVVVGVEVVVVVIVEDDEDDHCNDALDISLKFHMHHITANSMPVDSGMPYIHIL